MTDISTIKSQLCAKIEALCSELLPNGKRRGAEWCTGDADDTPATKAGSFRVHLTGDKAGVWSDFGDGKQSGDVIELVCVTKGLMLSEALKWSKQWLGISDPQFTQTAKQKFRKPERRDDCVKPTADHVLGYLTNRGLTPEIIAELKIGEIEEFYFKDEEITCPAIVFPFFVNNQLTLIKYLGTERPEGKKLLWAEYGCKPVLFGWHLATGNERAVIICEGEINAMSWRQLGHFALATPFGAGKGQKHKWLDHEWERFEQFETIYLDFDDDDPGKAAVEELSQRLGQHRCKVIKKPTGKDINDLLIAGITQEDSAKLLQDAQSNDPPELRPASDFCDKVIEYFYPTSDAAKGFDTGYQGFGHKFRWRAGEVTIITGHTKHGKSAWAGYELLKLARYGERSCVASFEMTAGETLGRMTRQLTGAQMPAVKTIHAANQWMADKLWVYDKMGSDRYKRVLEVFDYAWRRYNIKWFLIDSLMRCGLRKDDYSGQAILMDDLCEFVAQHPTASIWLIAHGRKEDDNSPVGRTGIEGAHNLPSAAHNVLEVYRNKSKENAVALSESGEAMSKKAQDALNGPDAYVMVHCQRRNDGYTPRASLYYDAYGSLQYADYADQYGKPLVNLEIEADYPEF